MEIQETKDVWVAWSNTDCTEGRGRPYAKYICESQACAIRKGKGGSVQGSNCQVTKSFAVKIKNQWLVPGYVESNLTIDNEMQKHLDEAIKLKQRLLEAGFSEEEIKKIKGV